MTACGLAALALVLVGCTDDRVRPSDTLPPTSETTATATTEDLPGPPGYPFPPEALEYTEAGALAFFNYYVDVLNKTTETLDSEPIRLLSGSDCQGCESRVEMYDADRTVGLIYDGGSITVAEDTLSVQLRPDVQGGPGARINTGGTGSALTVFDASGVAVAGRAYPAYDLSISVSVAWFPAQLTWQVASLSLVVA